MPRRRYPFVPDSFAKLGDLRYCCIRDMVPVLLLQRLCMAVSYTGDTSRISNVDLLDCLHAEAYHKRKLDAISAEESLCSIARPVDPATKAADMARFVETIFGDMCKFVAEVGISDFSWLEEIFEAPGNHHQHSFSRGYSWMRYHLKSSGKDALHSCLLTTSYILNQWIYF